jgi:hypothetical protein
VCECVCVRVCVCVCVCVCVYVCVCVCVCVQVYAISPAACGPAWVVCMCACVRACVRVPSRLQLAGQHGPHEVVQRPRPQQVVHVDRRRLPVRGRMLCAVLLHPDVAFNVITLQCYNLTML